MLFQPSGKLNIIEEEAFETQILEVEKELEKYIQKGYFQSFDGASIYYEYFLAQNAKASIVIVHGYTEFTRK